MKTPKNTMLVTGAISGLGKATYKHLSEVFQEYQIVGTHRKPGQVHHLHGTTMVPNVDVTERATLENAFKEAKAIAPVRVAINCAGILQVPNDPAENDRRVIETNLVGALNFIKVAEAAIDDNEADWYGGRGLIILVSSMMHKHRTTVPLSLAAYAASKAGVDALVRLYADVLGKNSRIRVVGIAPGPFATAMLGMEGRELRAGVRTGPGPFPDRMGDPKEFAQLVEHIIRNPYINGTTIEISGNQ